MVKTPVYMETLDELGSLEIGRAIQCLFAEESGQQLSQQQLLAAMVRNIIANDHIHPDPKFAEPADDEEIERQFTDQLNAAMGKINESTMKFTQYLTIELFLWLIVQIRKELQKGIDEKRGSQEKANHVFNIVWEKMGEKLKNLNLGNLQLHEILQKIETSN